MASLVSRPDNPFYYIQFHVAGKPRRVSTGTDTVEFPEQKEETKPGTAVVAKEDGADSTTNVSLKSPTGKEEDMGREEETKSLRIAG